MSKTVAASVVDGVVVAAICEVTPTDRDWQNFVALLKAQDAAALLIHSAGGALDACRRMDLRYAIQAREVRVALVSDVSAARQSVFMLAVFLSEIQSFRDVALSDALAYLRITGERREMITAELQRLRTEVTVPEPSGKR